MAIVTNSPLWIHKFMKKFIKTLRADNIVFIGSIISLFFILVSMIVVGIYFSSLPPYLPLFHQLPWGIERLGRKLHFFLPGCYVSLIFLGNLFLSSVIYEKMPLVARIITITNVLLSLILFLFTIRTIQLII